MNNIQMFLLAIKLGKLSAKIDSEKWILWLFEAELAAYNK